MSPKSLNSLSEYGAPFQTKVISSLLTHPKFLKNIHDVLNPDDFSSKAHQWIVKEILKYYKEYSTTPTMEVLKIELKKIENEVLQISIREHLREAYKSSEGDLEYNENEFTKFCKNQQLKKALLNSVDLLKEGDYDSIKTIISNALKSGQDRNLGHEYVKELEERYRDNRVIVPTPWDDINELLQGGLGNGDLGIIFGNPGGGKSWALIDIGTFCLKLGYNVLHFTLELSEKYVGKRYDANLSKIAVNKVEKHKEELKGLMGEIKGNLLIKEYPPKRASLHTLESHYHKCAEAGVKPDIILIDYLDLLKPTNKSIIDRKDAIDDIYIETKGVAKELNLPIWSVSQVNRAGAQDDIIEGDKSAGSYDKIMIADFLASLSRKRKDKVEGTGRLHIIKNRYGIDGVTFMANIDLSIGSFEFSEFDEESYNKEMEISNQKFSDGKISNIEKQKLKEKFFDLKLDQTHD